MTKKEVEFLAWELSGVTTTIDDPAFKAYSYQECIARIRKEYPKIDKEMRYFEEQNAKTDDRN